MVETLQPQQTESSEFINFSDMQQLLLRLRLGDFFLNSDLHIGKLTPELVAAINERNSGESASQKLLDKRTEQFWRTQAKDSTETGPQEKEKIVYEGEATPENDILYLEKHADYREWKDHNKDYFERHPELVQALSPIFAKFGVEVDPDTNSVQLNSFQIAALYKRYRWKNYEDPQAQTEVNMLIQDYEELCSDENGNLDEKKFNELGRAMMLFSGIIGDNTEDLKKNITLSLLISRQISQEEIIDIHNKKHILSKENLEKDDARGSLVLIKEFEEKDEDEQNKAYILPKVLTFDKESIFEETSLNLDEFDKLAVFTETGTGKSTGIARIWRHSIMKERTSSRRDIFYLIEPTQITTATVAKEVALKEGEELGGKIGFVHGLEKQRNQETEEVLVMTNGIFSPIVDQLFQKRVSKLNEMVGIEGKLTIMFDEMHKKSPGMVVDIFLLQELQKLPEFNDHEGNSRIRLIFATATGDEAKDIPKLGGEKLGIMKKEGCAQPRTFEWGAAESKKTLSELYSMRPSERNKIIAKDILAILQRLAPNEAVKNIASFVSGGAELEEVAAEIHKYQDEQKFQNEEESIFFSSIVDIIKISGKSTKEQREAVSRLEIQEGERVLYDNTNAAEAGVTFKNVSHLIDTDLVKVAIYDWETGSNKLETRIITKAEKAQRDGRVGRDQRGFVISPYMSGEIEYESLADFPGNESERLLCVREVLRLYKHGFRDISKINELMLTIYPKDFVTQSMFVLGPSMLNAIDADGEITEIGKEILEQPIDFRLTRALHEAKMLTRDDCTEQVISIIAIRETINRQPLFEELDMKKREDQEKKQNRVKMWNQALQSLELKHENESNFMLLLHFWRKFEENVGGPLGGSASLQQTEERQQKLELFCREYGVSADALTFAEELKTNLSRKNSVQVTNTEHSWEEDLKKRKVIERCFKVGFKDRILKKNKGKDSYSLLLNPISPKLPAHGFWVSPEILIAEGSEPFTGTMKDFPEYLVCANLNTDGYSGVVRAEIIQRVFANPPQQPAENTVA